MKPYDPKDDVAQRTTDPAAVHVALLLTDFDSFDMRTITGWDENERALAYEWAMREHLYASDNSLDHSYICMNVCMDVPLSPRTG